MGNLAATDGNIGALAGDEAGITAPVITGVDQDDQSTDVTQAAAEGVLPHPDDVATYSGDVTPAAGEEDEAAPEHDKQPKWARKTITRLASQKRKAVDRAEQAEKDAAETRKELAELKGKQAVIDAPAIPQEKDFGSDVDYMIALSKWTIDTEKAKDAAQASVDKGKVTVEERQQDFRTGRDSMYEAGNEKHTDFETALASMPGDVMTLPLAEAILDTGNPADVAYYLSQNIDEAAKIEKMPERQRAITLGGIDARLSIVPTKKQTTAPDPITPLGGNSVTAVDESKLSDQQWYDRQKKNKLASG